MSISIFIKLRRINDKRGVRSAIALRVPVEVIKNRRPVRIQLDEDQEVGDDGDNDLNHLVSTFGTRNVIP